MSKTYKQFKTIAYKMAKPHKVYFLNKTYQVSAKRALPKRSTSSAAGD
jgi:hypothetical protein